MADIVVVPAKIARIFPGYDEVYDFIAAVTITRGLALYVDANGKIDLYDSNGSGTLQFAGVALTQGGAGQAISVLKRGYVYGYTVSGLAYWAPLYGSNTAGAIADAAGTSSIIVGRVVPLSDAGLITKVTYIQASWNVLSA